MLGTQYLLFIPSNFSNNPFIYKASKGQKGQVACQAQHWGQDLNPDLMTQGLGLVPSSHLQVPLRAAKSQTWGDIWGRRTHMGRAHVTLWEDHFCLLCLVCPGKSHIFCRTTS